MPLTAAGLPYPLPSDPVSEGAAAIQALAEAIPTRLVPATVLEATGDGVTDDTVAFNNAVAITPTGGVLVIPRPASFYKLTGPVVIDRPMTVQGLDRPQLKQTTSTAKGFEVTTSDVRIIGLRLTGPGGTTRSTATGIHASGLSAGSPLTDLTVLDCELDGWNGHGIYVKWLHRLRVESCDIHDLCYSAITVECGIGGQILGNTIRDINMGGGATAYGVLLTRPNGDSLTDVPRTADYLVHGNIVRNVPWEGIDTHGGERIGFSDNIITGCETALAVVDARNSAGAATFAAKHVTITGNLCDSGVDNGTASPGIVIVGATTGPTGSVVEYASGVIISGNTVRGYGDDSSNLSGAVVLYGTSGLILQSNVIDRPAFAGVLAYHNNARYHIAGNTFLDAWSNAQTFACCVHAARSNNNTGFIGHNTAINTGTKTGTTHLLSRGVYVQSGTGTDLVLAPNDFAATTTPRSGGDAFSSYSLNVGKLGFFGTAPVGKAAALPGADMATIDATYGTEESGVLFNVRARLNDLETKLKSYGLLT